MSNSKILVGWAMLEAKLIYYYPHLIHPSWNGIRMSDEEYDQMLRESGVEETVVGFPMDTPSGRLVLSHLTNEREQGQKTYIQLYREWKRGKK